jgi:hypothetical protein
MSDEKYIKGIYIKEVDGKFGKEMKASIKVDEFLESIKSKSNNGWANIKITKRKEPSEKGNTHFVVDDTYVKKEPQPEVKEVNGNVLDKDESLPF